MFIEEDKVDRKRSFQPMRMTKEKVIITCGIFFLGFFFFGIFSIGFTMDKTQGKNFIS